MRSKVNLYNIYLLCLQMLVYYISYTYTRVRVVYNMYLTIKRFRILYGRIVSEILLLFIIIDHEYTAIHLYYSPTL